MAEREMLRYWVWLSQVFGAGSTRVLKYLRTYDSPKEIYAAFRAGTLSDLTPRMQQDGEAFTLERADSIVHMCISSGIRLLTIDDADYPQSLRGIHTPPVLLTALGNYELLNKPLTLAVVGTRHPTPYSERVARATVQGLGKNDFVIVSGFALGIDKAAHTAALDAGYGTIAVLGCGVNVNYPKENTALRERMLTSGRGLLLSEYLPGERPNPANFPKRNRILSGLCYATAVIEAADGSGSLLTAKCAEEQGRHLLCVPPPDLFDKRYRGVFPLLRNGALPLLSGNDVLAVYFDGYAERLRMPHAPVRSSERAVYATEQPEKRKYAGKPRGYAEDPFFGGSEKQSAFAEEPESELPAEPDDLLPLGAEPQPAPQKPPAPVSAPEEPESEDSAQLLQYIRAHGGADVDTLAAALDLDLSTVLSTLMMLEIEGKVTSLFGKQYYPAE